MANDPLKKSFGAKTAAFDDGDGNILRVVASGTGYADRYGDVIMPGAWAKAVLKDFLKNGWIDVGHEWSGLPIAMPVEAKVDGDDLVSACQFHSTERGQEAKTVCQERLSNDLSVSVSVGFWPDYEQVRWFSKGIDLLNWAKEAGYDMSRLDEAGIKKLAYCRAIPAVDELSEWSIVCIGANTKAKAIEMKSGPTPEEFAEHLGDAPKGDSTPAEESADDSPRLEERTMRLRTALLRSGIQGETIA